MTRRQLPGSPGTCAAKIQHVEGMLTSRAAVTKAARGRLDDPCNILLALAMFCECLAATYLSWQERLWARPHAVLGRLKAEGEKQASCGLLCVHVARSFTSLS